MTQPLLGRSLTNMALRGASMLGKLLLMFGLAHYVSPGELGLYSLVYASTSIGILLLGAKFDVYSTRAICSGSRSNLAAIIRDQIVFHLVVYVAGLPLFLVLFAVGVLPWSLIGWFYLLLLLEHSGQECYRWFVALGQPVRASFVFFIRNGMWCFALLALMLASPRDRNLNALWILWALGGVASLALSTLWMRNLGWRSAFKSPIDWAWIARGLRPSASYSIAIGALTLIGTMDRFFLVKTWGQDHVGVYSFYSSLTNFVPTLADTGIIALLLPTLISSASDQRWHAYRATLGRLARGVWVLVAVAVLLSALVAPMVLYLVKREPIYGEFLPVFAILMASSVAGTLSLIPHNALYAMHRDREIAVWSVAAMLIAVCGYALMAPSWGVYGVAAAALASSLAILGGKTWSARRLSARLAQP